MLVNNEAFNLLLRTTHFFFFHHLIQHSATGSHNNSYTFQVFLRGSKNNPEMHNQTQQHFGHHLFDTRCNGARHWLQARLTHCCVHLRCGLCHKYIGWMVVQGGARCEILEASEMPALCAGSQTIHSHKMSTVNRGSTRKWPRNPATLNNCTLPALDTAPSQSEQASIGTKTSSRQSEQVWLPDRPCSLLVHSSIPRLLLQVVQGLLNDKGKRCSLAHREIMWPEYHWGLIVLQMWWTDWECALSWSVALWNDCAPSVEFRPTKCKAHHQCSTESPEATTQMHLQTN